MAFEVPQVSKKRVTPLQNVFTRLKARGDNDPSILPKFRLVDHEFASIEKSRCEHPEEDATTRNPSLGFAADFLTTR